MTIFTLLVGLAVFAIILTTIQRMSDRKLIKNYLISWLQNFVGGLFIFSGLVKAVDPLGTAYKMEQYFAEFETTFAGTKAAFLAPMFPTLAEYAIAFSVFMIVFEILLGFTLLLGVWRKFTVWAFFLLVVFFTFLTGFTYLTGYVPEGVNFFQFGQWTAFEPTNMKVTDCGCFGDFLKLEPFVSFQKDIFLLIPGILFLFTTKSFHQLTKGGQRALAIGLAMVISILAIYINGYPVGWRLPVFAVVLIGLQFLSTNASVWAGIVALLLYSFSNYVTDIPQVDFRPFRVDANIAERKALEEEAEANVEVLAYKMTNKASGEVVELPFDQYLQEYQNYPSEEWDLDQIKSEPAVERTKISDFEVSDLEGNDVTYDILSHEGYSMMIIAYKLSGNELNRTEMQRDSVFAMDTVITDQDTLLSPRFVRMDEKEITVTDYEWKEGYLDQWTERMVPIAEAAQEAGVKVYAVTSYAEPERLQNFQESIGATYPIYMADDILLKTIVRSNPGLVLMKNGTILEKWHYRKLPNDFASLREANMQ